MLKNKETKTEKPYHPVKSSEVKPGDIMAFTYWGKIKSVLPGGRLIVDGLDAGVSQFEVHGDQLIENSSSADQFHETIKCSMTEVAEKLIGSTKRPLTVCFDKQDGTERVMRCRLIDSETFLGRSRVEDLEKEIGDRFRLVDHRTLKWLVVDGVKYEVSKKH